MSYTPTSWKKGDVVTAEKLNKIENGISSSNAESSVMFVTLTQDTGGVSYTVNKTYAEMVAAHNTGKLLVLVMDDDGDSILYLKAINESFISFMNFAVTMYPDPAYLECTRVIISSEDEVTVQVGTLIGD